MNRSIFIVALALGLFGCGPKYELVKQRQAPVGEAAANCMKECRIENSTCSSNCAAQSNICMDEQKIRATADWPHKLELFNVEMEAYHAQKSSYDQQKTKNQAEINTLTNTFNTYKYKCKSAVFNRSAYCAQAETARLQLLSALSDTPKEPKKPKKLSLAQLTSEYQESCSQECGCESTFDMCFQTCGGTVETKRVCVSGCE